MTYAIKLRNCSPDCCRLAALVDPCSVGVSGCNKLKARDLLNKGVAAFKSGQSGRGH